MARGYPQSGSSYGRRKRKSAASTPNLFSRLIPDVVETPVTFGVKGYLGLVGNLATDVKDSVVGLPMGAVHLATDPKDALATMAKSTWQTYSPLFDGDFVKFGKGLYDHPLAPILDVLSVVTLGAGSAARGAGALSKAGVGGSRTKAVAGLRGLKDPIPLKAPAGKPGAVPRPDLDFYPSERAARYAVQKARMSIEQHMPDWYVKPMQRFRYERAWATEIGGRVVAKSLVLSQILEAGRLLTDDVTAPAERMKLLTGNHLGGIRHSMWVAPEEAVRLGANKRKGHMAYTRDILQVGPNSAPQIAKLRKKELRYHYERESTAELANSIKKIEDELAAASARLSAMHSEGVRIAMPASTRKPTQKQLMAQQAAPFKEQEKIIRDLEKRLDAAHVAAGKHNRAIERIDQYHSQRVALENRDAANAYAHAAVSDEAFQAAARNLGRTMTTRDVSKAARDSEGRVAVIPRHDAYNLGLEMDSSSKFVKYVYHKPTQLWKMATIGYAPRAITNNAVGNWTLYALREGLTPDSAKAIHDAVSWQWGAKRAQEIFDEEFVRRDVITREFGDVVGNVFSAEMKGMGRAKQGLYPIVHTVADKPVRVASLYKFFRSQPEVKALLREGVDIDDAITRVLQSNPALRGHAVNHVNKTAGDYVGLTKAEQHLRQVVPFYLWYRHIARTTGNLVADTPVRATILARLSAMGIEDTEELLGEIPEFLNGAIPLSALGLGDKKDRPDILLTSSLNPFASIGELASLVEAFGPGTGRPSAGAIGLNPFLVGAAESMFGRSLLTGAPKEGRGGVLTSVLAATLEGLPQARLAQALVTPDTGLNPSGTEKLFAADDRSPLTGILGVPLRSLSIEAAERIARTESEKSSGQSRRRKRGY